MRLAARLSRATAAVSQRARAAAAAAAPGGGGAETQSPLAEEPPAGASEAPAEAAEPTAEAAEPTGEAAEPTGEAGEETGEEPLAEASEPAAEAGEAPGEAEEPPRVAEELAASAFARLSLLPAIVVMAWLIPGLPLLLGGVFEPVPALLISVPLAAVLAAAGLRWLPARWPRRMPGPARDRAWAAWWALIGTAVVAASFIAWQLLENSPAIISARAPGTYLQTGYWIAQHGSLPIPKSLAAFGGPRSSLRFATAGFSARGGSVIPDVTAGLPLVLAAGFWTQGISAATALSPVLGGLAIVAFAGLVARLAGIRWAPAGALVLALALPEQYVSRSALPEPLVQILLFGGLSMTVDALMAPAGPLSGWHRAAPARWPALLAPQRLLALLGGLALGLSVLADLASLAPLLAVIPFAGVLAARRKPAVVPLCAGVAVGAGYGLAGGYLLAGPYLASVKTELALAGTAAAWLAALTVLVLTLLRRPRLRRAVRRAVAARPLRWLPEAAALLAAAALVMLAIRPYLQTVRGTGSPIALHYIAALQQAQHLPVDPARRYAEDTLYWVIWYVGVPAVLLGGFGFALLVRRVTRALLGWHGPAAAERNWGLPLLMIGAGSAAALWMPDITPDQPWASRRLLIMVIPGLIACALWAGAWLTGLSRARGAGRATATAVAVFCVVALAVPAAATSFGLGLSHRGRTGGLAPSSNGLALRATGTGQISAVRSLCASIPPHSAVLIVDRRTAAQFAQVIRGSCGVPVAWLPGSSAAAVGAAAAAITRAGRRPVLLGARRAELTALGGIPQLVMDLRTTQDPHSLTQPPAGPEPARYVVWLAALGAPASGA